MFPGRFCAPRLLFRNREVVTYHLNHSLVSGWASSRWSRSGSLRGNTRIWFTSKVAKEALPTPSHFIGNPQGFIDTPVLVVLLPPRRVLRFEVGGGEILLLLPLLVGRWDGEGVQVGPSCLPETLRSWGGCRRCSRGRGGWWSRAILISQSLKYYVLHAPKFCHLVHWFQNCFCFCSATFPSHVGTFFRLQWEFQWGNDQNK